MNNCGHCKDCIHRLKMGYCEQVTGLIDAQCDECSLPVSVEVDPDFGCVMFEAKEPEGAVYCVCVNAGGAYEAECVYSIWTDEAAAEHEAWRLNTSGISLGCYEGRAYVKEVKINIRSNEWIA